jgi:LuxR family maltose regulon positive regulatory protein
MARKSSKSTATIIGRYLYSDVPGIAVGSPEWFEWLEAGRSFYFSGERSFTARCEKRRNTFYWYAFKKINGKLRKVYMGVASDLTYDHLIEIAQNVCDA